MSIAEFVWYSVKRRKKSKASRTEGCGVRAVAAGTISLGTELCVTSSMGLVTQPFVEQSTQK